MNRQIFLDIETTGLSVEKNRIIEIGIVEVMSENFSTIEKQYYFNVPVKIEKGAFEVHGITQEFLQNKPPIQDKMQEIINFISGAEVVMHNASFDVRFLNMELKRLDMQNLASFCTIVDSLVTARKLHASNNSLDALCKKYGLDYKSQRHKHSALVDARLLSQLYFRMTSRQVPLFTDQTLVTDTALDFLQIDGDNTRLINLYDENKILSEHESYLNFMQSQSNQESLWKTKRRHNV